MENEVRKNKNIWKLLIMLACTAVMLGTFLVTVRYACMMQHVSASDGTFFSGGSLWLSFLKLMAGILSMDIFTFCHKVWPWLFVTFMLVEYFFLGLRLFVEDGMSFYYSYSLSCIFVSIYMIILHVGYISEDSLEAMVYLNSWSATAVSGILLFPLLVLVLLWKKDIGFRIPFIIMVTSLYMGISGMENWRNFILRGITINYIGRGWILMLAVIGVTTMIVMKRRPARYLVIAALLSTITFTPYPLGLMAAYGVTGLIGRVYIKSTKEGTRKSYVTGALITAVCYGIFAATVLAAGFFSNSRVSWNVGFSAVENDRRLPEDLMKLTDYIVSDSEEMPHICGSDITASAVLQYSVLNNLHLRDVRGLWHEAPLGEQEIKEKINEIDKEMYVIIKGSSSDADKLTASGDLHLIKKFGDYGLYGR